jgi:hypothetical protein
MNDDTLEDDKRNDISPVEHGQAETAITPTGRASIAEEQLQAATRVIESELDKAHARARALNARVGDLDQ